MSESKTSDAAPIAGRLDSWHVTPSNNQNFEFLDGIRGIAILLVVFCHLFYINPKSTGVVKFVGSTLGAGHIGVTVFFTLSGFLISAPFWKGKLLDRPVALKKYFLRRFWKIYPPLALSVILLLPCYIWFYGDAWEYAKTAFQWLTGAAWLVPVSGKLNPVMWSLIVEVHFYLLLPLAFLCLRRVSYRATLWILFLGLLLVPTATKSFYAMHGLEFGLHPIIHVLFPTKLDAFAAGVLLAGLHQKGILSPRLAPLGPIGIILLGATLLLAGAASVSPTIASLWTSEALHYSAMLASAFLLCFLANPELALKCGLCLPWLRWVGLISYEWYLFHQAPHVWARHLLSPAEGNLGKYLIMTLPPMFGSLILAALVYWKFSLPILRKQRG